MTVQRLPDYNPFGIALRFGFKPIGTIGVPGYVTVKIPHQENLTQDMLGSVSFPGIFYTDPGLNRQMLTMVNPLHQQFYGLGWTPPGVNISNRSILGVRPFG